MANFCQNCGAPMTQKDKFCAECGAPAADMPTRSPQPPVQQTQQPPVPTVDLREQPVREQPTGESAYHQAAAVQTGSYSAAPQVKTKTTAEKKEKKGGKAILILLLIALIALAGFFGFRDGGWFRGGKSYDPQHLQSLLVYAQELEKAGNSEAAEAVYELIIKGGGAELIQKAHEDMPVVEKTDEIEQMEEVFGHLTGGGR